MRRHAAVSVQHEVEDLAAMVAATGETPLVYGHSPGAALALEAGAAGVPVRKLAVDEPPYVPGEGTATEMAHQLASLCASGQPDEAAVLFLRNTGMPDEQLGRPRSPAPRWPSPEGRRPRSWLSSSRHRV